MKSLLFIIAMCAIWACCAQKIDYFPIKDSGEIVFKEDFEKSSLSDIFSNWNDIKNGEGMSISNDVPLNSKGKQSLMMTYTPTPGKIEGGGHLYKLLPEGYDSLFARFYIKFISRYSTVSHLVQLGGNYPPTEWPKGGAGSKPKGDDTFITCVEPLKDKWEWGFYTYWMN